LQNSGDAAENEDNLAASLENRNKDVNALMYRDAGHGAYEDAEDFIAWVGKITVSINRN
jgi:hypothetical protein